jgi:6-pyruvoyltetrahydropterin/6-carboxytetrahydropterin synthase
MANLAPKAYFTRAYTISASHRLHAEEFSAEENRAVFGKCNNPYGHGHNYRIEVTIGGGVDCGTGMVLKKGILDLVVHENVLARFDHMNLNLDPLFSNRVPTTENLCVAVFNLLDQESVARALQPAKLEKIRVEETENNFFEYAGD